MAGFRKAEPKQAAVKVSIYGRQKKGKTFTALLCAEGIARMIKKRIAFVDTEHGTDFYAKLVPARKFHPEPFDFDALYTRSITEALTACQQLDQSVYGVVVLDSVSHLWDAAIAAYSGRQTSIGSIPMQAWGKIKKPYKELMAFLIQSPFHVFILGREANEFGDDENGELKKLGVKMRAEGETQYEPHTCIRMVESQHFNDDGTRAVEAYCEGDRTGILSGKSIVNPTFDTLIKPMMSLLGTEQAQMDSDDDTAAKDAEAIAAMDAAKERESANLVKLYSAKIDLAAHKGELKAIGQELTPAVKAKMLTADVAKLRDKYGDAESKLPPDPNAKAARAKKADSPPTVTASQVPNAEFTTQLAEAHVAGIVGTPPAKPAAPQAPPSPAVEQAKAVGASLGMTTGDKIAAPKPVPPAPAKVEEFMGQALPDDSSQLVSDADDSQLTDIFDQAVAERDEQSQPEGTGGDGTDAARHLSAEAAIPPVAPTQSSAPQQPPAASAAPPDASKAAPAAAAPSAEDEKYASPSVSHADWVYYCVDVGVECLEKTADQVRKMIDARVIYYGTLTQISQANPDNWTPANTKRRRAETLAMLRAGELGEDGKKIKKGK